MSENAGNIINSDNGRFEEWYRKYHRPDIIHHADGLPLRRDMVSLLQYIRDNKIIGTRSTGNMPLKAVREVTNLFVNPPNLETRIGDHIYHIRSEFDVWWLYLLHILADVGNLISIAPAQRWCITPDGEEFLCLGPLFQTSVLLSIWWYGVNWLVAYPSTGMGDNLPRDFEQVTLSCLRSHEIDKSISFEQFADDLINQTGLTWTAVDSNFKQMLLRGSIQMMIIRILSNFNAVDEEFQEKPVGKGTISDLVSFKITPFGKCLLDAVLIMGP